MSEPFSWSEFWRSNAVLHGFGPLMVGLAVLFCCALIPSQYVEYARLIAAASAGMVLSGIQVIGGRTVQAACSPKGFQ